MLKKNYGARFVKSCKDARHYPTIKADSGEILPEVAVVGRSNVGKSSLLNHLFGQKGLVKTSSVPGKTRLLNFFSIHNEVVFVDLPGYGYSQTSQKMQKGFQNMVTEYFEEREPLKAVLLLFDIRRDPNDEDRECLNWLLEKDLNPIVVLTKADKIGTTKRSGRKKEIVTGFGVDNVPFLLYSTPKNIGRDGLWRIIDEKILRN